MPLPSLGNILSLFKEGYMFGTNRFNRYNNDDPTVATDLFSTKLLEDCIFVKGVRWARCFYDPTLFYRHNALPKHAFVGLFGPKGVQTLNDDDHTTRKAIFLSILSPDQVLR